MERAIHFAKHGWKFGVADPIAYEQMADTFMFASMNSDTRECTRPNSIDRLRLDFIATHFGVANVNPDYLKTFYPVNPRKLTRHGGCAGFFAYECARVNL